jgi:hypothetical protein
MMMSFLLLLPPHSNEFPPMNYGDMKKIMMMADCIVLMS